MKTIVFVALAAVLSLGFHAVRTLESGASDVLRKLNIPESMAKESIWSSFSGRYLSIPNPQDLKRIARGERGALVQQIGEYARAYTKSDEFKKSYLAYRDNQKPTPPEPPKSVEQNRKEMKENLQKSIRETEANMKSMKPDLQAQMKDVVKMLREQLKQVDDPKNPMFSKQIQDMTDQSYEMQKKDHVERLARWELDYPLSPNKMIRSWLEEFLKISKDVDFNAALVDGVGGKKMFAKGEYEKKSDQWKMCYRAGKETVESGRAYATQWLKELEGTK